MTACTSGVRKVELLPVWVRGGRPEPAPEDAKLLKLIRGICEACGTQLTAQNEWQVVTCAEASSSNLQ